MNPALSLMGDARNRITSFDDKTGVLVTEAGVTLEDFLKMFLPRGWFPPVTPETKFVTLAGLMTADAQGKKHHGHGSLGIT